MVVSLSLSLLVGGSREVNWINRSILKVLAQSSLLGSIEGIHNHSLVICRTTLSLVVQYLPQCLNRLPREPSPPQYHNVISDACSLIMVGIQ
jgi:hypothetical protein